MGNIKDEWKKIESKGTFWKPVKIGDELIGIVEDIKEGKFGPQYHILNDEGVMITPSHKVLQNRLKEIKKGETIKIVMTGKELPTVKGYAETMMYEVYRK